MKKRSSLIQRTGLSILAGALSFTGASAAIVFSENFEGRTNIFNAPTYAYAANYTQANTLTPGGDFQYMHGGPGTPNAVSTNTFVATGDPYTLILAGIAGAQIDAGLVRYKFYAQFSTYHDQNDFGEVEILFLNAANGAIGSSINSGGSSFVSAIQGGAGNRAWNSLEINNPVPAGARSVSLVAFATKTAGGTNIDAYMDNILLEISIIPEPGSALSVILAGSMLASRRRRRDPS